MPVLSHAGFLFKRFEVGSKLYLSEIEMHVTKEWICKRMTGRSWHGQSQLHYNDVTMSAITSQITSLAIVYWTVYSRHRSKKTSKLRVTGLCARNSPETGEFPAQRASNAENVSIWWRHHETAGLSIKTIVMTSSHRDAFNITVILRGESTVHQWIPLTHWGRDKMAGIFQKTVPNAFSLMKMYEFRLKIHWNLCQYSSIGSDNGFGADQATSHYLNQWWYSLLTHICVTRPQWVKKCRSNRALIFLMLTWSFRWDGTPPWRSHDSTLMTATMINDNGRCFHVNTTKSYSLGILFMFLWQHTTDRPLGRGMGRLVCRAWDRFNTR